MELDATGEPTIGVIADYQVRRSGCCRARPTSRLVASAEGCAFGAADVAAVFADLTRAGLRFLASAQAPRRDEDVALGVGPGAAPGRGP